MSKIATLGSWDNLAQVELYTKSVRWQKLLKNVVSWRQEKVEKDRPILMDGTKTGQNLSKLASQIG